jgi:hypothetical protein
VQCWKVRRIHAATSKRTCNSKGSLSTSERGHADTAADTASVVALEWYVVGREPQAHLRQLLSFYAACAFVVAGDRLSGVSQCWSVARVKSLMAHMRKSHVEVLEEMDATRDLPFVRRTYV